MGPFSFQDNNNTRIFEYPWSFYAANIRRGHRVVEIGGSLSGFQFVLDKYGCQVVNIDPGMEARGHGWPCDQVSIARLNKLFGTSVKLESCTIGQANLEPNTVD